MHNMACGKRLDLSPKAEMSGKLTCVICAQVDDLQETVKRLYTVREAELERVNQIQGHSALN